MKIGLTQRVLFHKERAYDSIEHGWYSYLKDHTLITIPNIVEQDFDLLAENLDLLFITGGDDHPVRILTEIRIATAMLKQQKPIIGICHGAFLLTDTLGGQISNTIGHTDTKHVVNYKDNCYQVNSYHSTCIKSPPITARVLCTDELGNCEAWIDRNIAAIVWHPERMETPWLPNEVQQLLK